MLLILYFLPMALKLWRLARLISREFVVPYLGVRLEPQKALETVNLELGLD